MLAACQAGMWAAPGKWHSKRDAAQWAAAQLADPAPVAQALAHRADPTAPVPTPTEVADVTDRVELLLAARTRSEAEGNRGRRPEVD